VPPALQEQEQEQELPQVPVQVRALALEPQRALGQVLPALPLPGPQPLQKRKPLPRKLQLLRHLLQHQRQQRHPLRHPHRPLRQRLLQQHRPHRLPPPPWRMVG